MGHPLGPEELRALKRKARRSTVDALQALGGEAPRAEIVARALKAGRFTQRELAAPAPPKAQRYGCRVVYELSWALSALKQAGLLTNPSRGVWALAADPFARPPVSDAPAPAPAASFPPPFVATITSQPPPAPAPVTDPPRSRLRRLLSR